MATPWGSPTGPVYPLGLFTVATAHTVVTLDANVPITNAFGTASGGIKGLSTTGSPAPILCNQIKCMAPSANTGDVYLVFKGQASNGTGGTSVILSIPKGTERVLIFPYQMNGFSVDQYAIDADTNSDKCYVTLVIV